ncbi:MAG: hypothetical protein E7213_05400 [Clostridium sp.]|nr:hypothetical protein [Clostridium sp.]
MSIEKVKELIDKDINFNERKNQSLIINELSRDTEELLIFLEKVDEFYFKYTTHYLTEIILKVYSKSFMEKFKNVISNRYNYDSSSINYNNVLKICDNVND